MQERGVPVAESLGSVPISEEEQSALEVEHFVWIFADVAYVDKSTRRAQVEISPARLLFLFPIFLPALFSLPTLSPPPHSTSSNGKRRWSPRGCDHEATIHLRLWTRYVPLLPLGILLSVYAPSTVAPIRSLTRFLSARFFFSVKSSFCSFRFFSDGLIDVLNAHFQVIPLRAYSVTMNDR